MSHPRLFGVVLAISVTLSAAAAGPAGKAKKRPESIPGSAMKVHVDPATGALVAAPDPTRTAAPAPTERSEVLPPLVVENAPVTGGGQMIRLDGRFMEELTATVSPDGKVSTACEAKDGKSAPAPKGDRHDR